MPSPTKILALHAHPDDIEFQCAGTLILLREAGCEVTIATMTPGDCGSAAHNAEEIAAIRREEARSSASMIGAQYICLEFRDLAIFNDDESRRRVTEALRRVAPSIILTAPPADYIADHEMTSLLVRDACFAASCPNYATRQWDPAVPLVAIPQHLYFVHPVEGRGDRDGPGGAGGLLTSTSPGFSTQSARCSPVTPASATGSCVSMGSMNTSRCRSDGAASSGAGDWRGSGRGVSPVSRPPISARQPTASVGGNSRPFEVVDDLGGWCFSGRGGARSGPRSRVRRGTPLVWKAVLGS